MIYSGVDKVTVNVPLVLDTEPPKSTMLTSLSVVALPEFRNTEAASAVMVELNQLGLLNVMDTQLLVPSTALTVAVTAVPPAA